MELWCWSPSVCWSGSLLSAGGGTPDPTDPSTHLSHFAVVVDSGILVLREGLETILVLAVLTASMRGANSGYRKPLALGAGAALLASVVTWFVAIAITDAVGPGSLELQAATGLLAIVVLLVVMNWFFHRVYWTGWIAHHNKRRKELIGGAGSVSAQRTLFGLALLGFTSVYREGFEVVLFLQNLRLRYGSGVVLEGVALGLVLVAVIGYATFGAAAAAALQADAGGDRGPARRRAPGHGRRERAGVPAGRLDRARPRSLHTARLDGPVVLDLPQRRRRSSPRWWRRWWCRLLLPGRGAPGPPPAPARRRSPTAERVLRSARTRPPASRSRRSGRLALDDQS